MSYNAIGESVTLVERVKAACQPGQILATEVLARRIEQWVTMRRVGSIDLPGSEQSLELFEIVERKS